MLIGDNGDNSFLGHLGADTFFGKGGDDFIDAVDGQRDKAIVCGGGDDERRQGPRRPDPAGCWARSRQPGLEALLADQRHEAAGADRLASQLLAAATEHGQQLGAVGGDRDDQAAALGELGEQRRRRRRRGGVDGDRLEGGALRQAAAAVADDHLDVGDAERGEGFAGARRRATGGARR